MTDTATQLNNVMADTIDKLGLTQHEWKATAVDRNGIWWTHCTCGWKSLGYSQPGKAFAAWQKRHIDGDVVRAR